MKNFKNLSAVTSFPVVFILCAFFNLFFLWPVLINGFTGDDWQLLYAYKTFGPDPLGGFLDVWMQKGLHTTIQFFYIGILERIFGFNLPAFQIINLLFKIFASLTLFFAVSKIFKDKLLAAFSAVIFSFIHSSAGAIAYVVKGTEYLGIGLMNLFFAAYYHAVIKNSLRLTILSSLILFLTFMSSPIRFYPLLGLIPLIEIYIILRKRNLNFCLKSAVRLTIFYLPVLFLILPLFGSSSKSSPLSLSQQINRFNLEKILEPLAGLAYSILGDGQLKIMYLTAEGLGILLLAVSLVGFIIWQKSKIFNKIFLLFFGPFFALFFLIATWFILGGLNIDSVHWYLIMPSVSMSLFAAALILLFYEQWIKSRKLRFLFISLVLFISIASVSLYEISSHYKKLFSIGTGAKDQTYMQNQILSSMNKKQLNALFFFDSFNDPSLAQYYAVSMNLGYIPNWVQYFKNPQFEGCVAYLVTKEDLIKSYNAKEDNFEAEGLCADNRYDLKFKKSIYHSSEFRAFLLKNKQIFNITDDVLKDLKP